MLKMMKIIQIEPPRICLSANIFFFSIRAYFITFEYQAYTCIISTQIISRIFYIENLYYYYRSCGNFYDIGIEKWCCVSAFPKINFQRIGLVL